MDKDTISGVVAGVVLLVALVLIFVPVKAARATVIDKRWTTTMSLREDYTTTERVCHTRTRTDSNGDVETYRDCGWEEVEHTRTIATASLSGGPTDPVVYPPPFDAVGDRYNVADGRFTITYREYETEKKRTNHVTQQAFEKRYLLGIECNIKLNIYGVVVADNCVALGR